MTTQNALIHDTVTNHLGPCDFSGKRCVTHESRAEGPLCIVVIDALDMATDVVTAVLDELRRRVEAERDGLRAEAAATWNIEDGDRLDAKADGVDDALDLLGGAR